MIRLIWHRMRQRYVIMWLLNVTFQRIQQIQQYYRTIAEFAEFAEFAEMWHSKSLLELLNVTAKVIQNKGCNYLRCHDNFCEFGNACSWSNRAFQNRIKITIMEEMRVKTQVQTDLFQNVVSGGTRCTTLGVDTQTRNNSPKYILYSYIKFFSIFTATCCTSSPLRSKTGKNAVEVIVLG